MVSMPRCGCQGNPARYSSGRSLRKSSNNKNGSNSVVSPKPKARRRCTPAPSSVGLDGTMRLTGRIDMMLSLPNFGAVRNGGLWLQATGLQQKWTNGGAPQEGTRLFLDGPTARAATCCYGESDGTVSASSGL